MQYYTHHIGDFVKATAGLTNAQAMTYLRMLWLYYENEKPLTDDLEVLAFQIGVDQNDVRLILKTFFTLESDGWRQSRCDEEITNFHRLIEAKSKGGKASAKRKFKTTPTDVEQVLNTSATTGEVTQSPNYPITQVLEEAIASCPQPPAKPVLPDCPHAQILKLWETHMPHLPQPRVWEGSRRDSMKARWIQASRKSEWSTEGYTDTAGGLKFWGSFFEYIAKETRLADGFESSNGRRWVPDLEWVCKAANFSKIIDGKYDK